MLLADEARAYFDEMGRDERDTLDALTRVAFSCELLKVTTRLMHVIAWLLTQRAVDAGELALRAMRSIPRGGSALRLRRMALRSMRCRRPRRALIASSQDLYRRVARLDSRAGRWRRRCR